MITLMISDWITENLRISIESQYKILYSLLTIIVFIILRYISTKLLLRKVENIKDRYYWSRSVQYIYTAIAFVIIFLIWISEFSNLATAIGLISAALVIVLRDLIINAAGWLFILIRSPFKLGDRVQIGDFAGDVIDIRIFQFTINEIGNWVDADQSTGRIIHIPNGKVFTEPQANFDRGFSYIWNEISVLITFESNWKKTKKLLEEIVVKHAADISETAQKKLLETSQKYMILPPGSGAVAPTWPIRAHSIAP